VLQQHAIIINYKSAENDVYVVNMSIEYVEKRNEDRVSRDSDGDCAS
jgi:hypothetical protein